MCTKDSYICSLHFVGGNGPTKEDHDPISAVASREKVGSSMYAFIIMFAVSVKLSFRAQVSRLSRKRKASCEREAHKERSKKICLKRSAAKTLLTLNRQTGKSKDEHAAASALLDLATEPVMSSGQPDEEMTPEFELGEQTYEFPEQMESQIDVDTQTDEKQLIKRMQHASK